MSAIASLESPSVEGGARLGFSRTPGWLADRSFDKVFLAGTTGVALMVGLLLVIEDRLFEAILLADLWLLGYHHVIATFSRILVEPDGLKRYRVLLTWVPFGVVVAVFALIATFGIWTLPTIYLYWQWWHYTRQSYGVAQMYRLKSGRPERTLLELKAVIYSVPLLGILHRSYQAPDLFLGTELKTIPAPEFAVIAAAGATAVVLVWWAARLARAWLAGELPRAYTFYLLSHLTIFFIGYTAFPSINDGWLVLNVWHNSQYLAIAWLFNSKRFKGEIDPAQRLLSQLSLRRNVAKYFATTLAVSTLVYLLLGGALALASAGLVPLAMVAYQVINFHHYIVDSQIWKVRRPEVRRDIGIGSQAA